MIKNIKEYYNHYFEIIKKFLNNHPIIRTILLIQGNILLLLICIKSSRLRIKFMDKNMIKYYNYNYKRGSGGY
tara:strand:+ start:342 stop:560 length:219 start_codon:yes stop_codon:yes gene_type:complete